MSGRAAVGWSSFRFDGTFLWTHAILPAGNVTTYLRPLSGAGRSQGSPRICAALSVPARCTWAAASWHASAEVKTWQVSTERARAYLSD